MGITVQAALRRADRRVADVREEPAGRLALREDFYRAYGFAPGGGLGSSELAFLRWLIARGVLASPEGTPAGSPWWRAVNEALLRDAERARSLYEAGLVRHAPDVGTRRWIVYLSAPSAVSWYRAHNGSVLGAYLDHAGTAAGEPWAEQQFLNIVLYRVLFAQAMVEGRAFAEWPLGKLASFLADPRRASVELLTGAPDFYPTHYPLTPYDILNVTRVGIDRDKVLVDVLDELVILPRVEELYSHCAHVLGEPRLMDLIEGGRPVYPSAPALAAGAR